MKRDITEIEKFISQQQKEWLIFRIAWVFMGLVLIAAALGLFGNGPISEQTYVAHKVHITYQKFMRADKESELYIGLQDQDLGQETTIGINNDYLKKVKIYQVVPQPAAVEIRDNTLLYRFRSVTNGFISFYLSPQHTGSQPLVITVGGKKMRFNQFIYF
jgi:hypothetical protein